MVCMYYAVQDSVVVLCKFLIQGVLLKLSFALCFVSITHSIIIISFFAQKNALRCAFSVGQWLHFSHPKEGLTLSQIVGRENKVKFGGEDDVSLAPGLIIIIVLVILSNWPCLNHINNQNKSRYSIWIETQTRTN